MSLLEALEVEMPLQALLLIGYKYPLCVALTLG